MKRSLPGRRKIALLFILGVGIPSLLLGYLAFRGIRSGIALSEQRRLTEHRDIARLAQDLLESEISSVEEGLSSAANASDPAPQGRIDQAMDLLEENPSLIEAIFRVDGANGVHFTAPGLLYYLDGSLPNPVPESWPPTAAEHLREAREQEFRRESFSTAEAEYRRVLEAVRDSSLMAEALLAIARVQRKGGRPEASLATSSILADRYGHLRTVQGVPVGPVARLEEASLILSLGDSAEAFSRYLALYQGLVEGEWMLERGQYDFLATRISESLEHHLGRIQAEEGGEVLPALGELRTMQERRRTVTERLLIFQRELSGRFPSGLGAGWESSGAGGRRFHLESQSQGFLVLLSRSPGEEGAGLGLLLDEGALVNSLDGLLRTRLDPATSAWVLKGRDGRPLPGHSAPDAGSVTINATFPRNFPPWLIEFYRKPENTFRLLFASSQSIYLYSFLLLAVILAFGLVLTIRAMTQELELARMKSDFVSTVSHEFKSPLTSIRHMAEILQAGTIPSEERKQRYYDVLVEQSDRLSSMVTNILDLARIEEGRKEFHLHPTDVGEIVSDLVETTRHRTAHDGFEVDLRIQDPLPPVRADPPAMTQAISNLLDNAIKYSGDSKRIAVAVSAHSGLVTIRVEDQGVGIPSEDLDKIFDRFYRVGDALTRSVKGSGLGLALVGEIVDAHGGQVRVESTKGQGSSFFIDLPAMREE